MRAAFIATTTEIPSFNNKQSRRKRKHGKSRAQRHHYPICKSGVCSDNYNSINNNFSQQIFNIDDGDLTVKANHYASGQLRANNAKSFQKSAFSTNSHTGYGINGGPSFSNSFFNQNGNTLYESNLMHQDQSKKKFVGKNMNKLSQSNGKYKNKYNIDYDNRLEEEYEIIHKIE